MRYKIKTPSADIYREVLTLLGEEKVPILLTSERRHFIAAAEIPSRLQQELITRGATVTPDYQYDLEQAAVK